LLDFAAIFRGEHLHNAGPRLKCIEEHSVHLMALTIAVQAFGGAQLMRLEIEVTSRRRQCRQESPAHRRIAQNENGADRNCAEHQCDAIRQAPPITMSEHFIIQIGQGV
jgi:hypothetical protein